MAVKVPQKLRVSVKHLQIDKTQTTILAVIAGTIVVAVFALFATRALIEKGLYQRRAINAKHQVVQELDNNVASAQKLVTQYQVFAQQDPNLLGGLSSGTGPLDGDNAQIVLDSLPSTYDAPALASSVEKLLDNRNITIRSLDVQDNSTSNPNTPETAPAPIPMTFSFEGGSDYQTVEGLLQDFEQSIRPFDITNLTIDGTDNSLSVSVQATTYYQPAKTFNSTATKEVK